MKLLTIRWSTSRGVNSYGYTLCTLKDLSTQKTYRTCGGGYDMLGCAFGQWLKDNYLERLKKLSPYDEARSLAHYQEHGYQPHQDNYGLFFRNGNWYVDGACGLDCMKRLAKEIGLVVSSQYDAKKRETVAFTVEEIE